MRCTRIIVAFVLTTSLVFILNISASAEGGETQSLIVECLEAEYKSGNYVMYSPTVNRNLYVFPNISNSITVEEEQNTLLSTCILMYGKDNLIDWQQGYIYTFNFTVIVGGINNSNTPSISLGLATIGTSGLINEYTSLGDCTYTYSTSANSATYNITSVVQVDENFNNGGIEDYNKTFIALDIGYLFNDSTSVITIVSSNLSVNKAIGEDAYYQASLDAINNLPQSEYDYIYNRVPDAEGEIEQIKGDLNELTADLDLLCSEFYDLITGITDNEPKIYMPKMYIPHLDINLSSSEYFGSYIDGDGFFHPLPMLQTMSPGFMDILGAALTFIRIFLLITFVTIGLGNMIRLEWWL